MKAFRLTVKLSSIVCILIGCWLSFDSTKSVQITWEPMVAGVNDWNQTGFGHASPSETFDERLFEHSAYENISSTPEIEIFEPVYIGPNIIVTKRQTVSPIMLIVLGFVTLVIAFIPQRFIPSFNWE